MYIYTHIYIYTSIYRILESALVPLSDVNEVCNLHENYWDPSGIVLLFFSCVNSIYITKWGFPKIRGTIWGSQ